MNGNLHAIRTMALPPRDLILPSEHTRWLGKLPDLACLFRGNKGNNVIPSHPRNDRPSAWKGEGIPAEIDQSLVYLFVLLRTELPDGGAKLGHLVFPCSFLLCSTFTLCGVLCKNQ